MTPAEKATRHSAAKAPLLCHIQRQAGEIIFTAGRKSQRFNLAGQHVELPLRLLLVKSLSCPEYADPLTDSAGEATASALPAPTEDEEEPEPDSWLDVLFSSPGMETELYEIELPQSPRRLRDSQAGN